jgi:hypothetical protein
VRQIVYSGLFLMSCLSLISCNTTSKIYFASAANYPESKAFVTCSVDRARARAFDNKLWFKNDDLDVVIHAGMRDCEPIMQALTKRASADGMPAYKISGFYVELNKKVWDVAWDEIGRVRRERLKDMGLIR